MRSDCATMDPCHPSLSSARLFTCNGHPLRRAPSPPSLFSGALPTAMATPHHRTFPTEEQRRRRPQRVLLPSHPSPATPAPDAFTNPHAAACAILCGGQQGSTTSRPLTRAHRGRKRPSQCSTRTHTRCASEPRERPPALLVCAAAHGGLCGTHKSRFLGGWGSLRQLGCAFSSLTPHATCTPRQPGRSPPRPPCSSPPKHRARRRQPPSPPVRASSPALARISPADLCTPRQPAARTASATCPARLAAPAFRPPEPATPAPRHSSAPIAAHVLIASSSRCRRPSSRRSARLARQRVSASRLFDTAGHLERETPPSNF